MRSKLGWPLLTNRAQRTSSGQRTHSTFRSRALATVALGFLVVSTFSTVQADFATAGTVYGLLPVTTGWTGTGVYSVGDHSDVSDGPSADQDIVAFYSAI